MFTNFVNIILGLSTLFDNIALKIEAGIADISASPLGLKLCLLHKLNILLLTASLNNMIITAL